MNCGFNCSWSQYIKQKFVYSPLKNIQLTVGNQSVRGEAMITPYGLEGGPFYFFSRGIRDSIEENGGCIVFIDLIPDLPVEEILSRLKKDRGKNSISNFLRKQLNLSRIKLSLLRECTEQTIFNDFSLLAHYIKKLPLTLESARPIEEAISSSGGVSFKELDRFFMLKKYPGWFTAGEMVDWDAPTGGYLLQGCFSTAYMAVEGIKKYTKLKEKV